LPGSLQADALHDHASQPVITPTNQRIPSSHSCSYIAICGLYRHKPGGCIRLLDRQQGSWRTISSSSTALPSCLGWNRDSRVLVRLVLGLSTMPARTPACMPACPCSKPLKSCTRL
jgi:hypothetical protein